MIGTTLRSDRLYFNYDRCTPSYCQKPPPSRVYSNGPSSHSQAV
ncbi:hypothetical protein O77CONTIG1_04901 [Leptolyngbya sp. O-77]|nr:hypothetical protein O77CONTIG1_04901 [Leptolyngbya sp. O-77]